MMVVYMILVYSCVYAFTITAYDDFAIGGSHDDLLDSGSASSDIDPEGSESWMSSIGEFFGAIVDAFGYLWNLLSFNITNTELSDGTHLPPVMTWLPALMVLPVWLAVIYWLMPYAIKAMEAIGSWIPFT